MNASKKFTWRTCDTCGKSTGYSPDNPFVECRQRRPSDKSDFACTLAGHLKCIYSTLDSVQLPRIASTGGVATPDQWETWIEGEEARKAGVQWLS